ncbi:DUF4168 domain-containing protein [Olivibacter sp. XZL3]|uniref:DUF4168 domain-containing protein n=1 Tax=Olivibacter sp. XZL3 TaxID=1735116 RepID=UPI0010663F1D|nr:DUF4168 domain-containing protein [Olivibacter sp. XZL3]
MKAFKRMKRTYGMAFGTLALLWTVLANSVVYGQAPAQMQAAQQVKEDFNEEELDRFLNANEKIAAIQIEAQGEMVKIIEKEGMSVEKFNAIAEAQQKADSAAAKQDPKDVAVFEKAAEQIYGMQQGLEGEMNKAVEEEGLKVETYMQIAQAYQQSEKVRGMLDKKMKEKQVEGGQVEQQ